MHPREVDPRLAGIRLAGPESLAYVEERSTTGIPLERVRIIPPPHNFDPDVVQFYRLVPGDYWASAHRARRVEYKKHPAVVESFLFCVDGTK
jgi:hypothetical protein